MSNTAVTVKPGYFTPVKTAPAYEADLEPYASLFLKPFSSNKSLFTRKELETMCKDPLHSPRLIIYLIEMVKDL
jgi:hypothetical protein